MIEFYDNTLKRYLPFHKLKALEDSLAIEVQRGREMADRIEVIASFFRFK